MNLAHLLPDVQFTVTELTELAKVMHTPVLRKYFKKFQADQLRGIASGLPKPGESAEEYLRRQAVVVGTIAMLETVLDIENPQPEQHQSV